MIEIICSSCQALLSMDDAFAGGVCRCVHCGTIQTVPRASGRSAARSRTRPLTAAGVGGARSHGSDGSGEGSGLESMEASATCAPGGSGLDSHRSSAQAQTKAAKRPARRNVILVAVSVAVTLLLVAAAAVWLGFRNG